MEGQDNSDASGRQGRWTCEACGCHTNTADSVSCGICGTRRVSSLLRRAGHATASRLFSRSFAARRAAGLDMDDVDLDEMGFSLGGGDLDEMMADNDDHAAAALALEASGVAGAARLASAQGSLNRRLRSMGAASSSEDRATRPSPDDILFLANENAPLYQPTWEDPLALIGRNRGVNEITVSGKGNRNVAHLAVGAGEGRAIRAAEPFPRAPLPSSGSRQSPSARKNRRIFGFKVAFDHPRRERGANLGGSYLLGVSTSSFHAFGERNGLHQSRYFWGIEDGGSKFEGTRNGNSSRSSGRGGSSSYGIAIPRSDAPRNADNVLFGSREVVSVVVDMESRTLTYWRDGRLLGTLVSNLPRTGNLYPIAVPFNAGVSIVITGMDHNPLPLLQSYVSELERSISEQQETQRQKLVQQRAVLIRNGRLTPELAGVLKMIFSLYAQGGESQVDAVSACRLWYRCGMKLSSLESIFENRRPNAEVKESMPLMLSMGDFIEVMEKIAREDEDFVSGFLTLAGGLHDPVECKVGDVVELVEGYERFGDASDGPLQRGDRGVILEVKEGPKGERNSVRVLCNGCRWYYQPQALLTERSGLIESPAVWLFRTVLRSHAYDHKSLQPLSGKEVTPLSWEVGDFVSPKLSVEGPHHSVGLPYFGRIVSESCKTPRGQESEMVSVEFVGHADGFLTAGEDVEESKPELRCQHVKVSELIHTSCFPRFVATDEVCPSNNRTGEETETEGRTSPSQNSDKGVRKNETPEGVTVSESLRADIAGVSLIRTSAIDAVTKECEKGPASLASLFGAGLPDALISSLARMESALAEAEDVSVAISQIGKLAIIISKSLFPNCNDEVLGFPHSSLLATEEISRDSSTRDRRRRNLIPQQAALEDAVPSHVQSRSMRELLRGLSDTGDAPALQHRRMMLHALMAGSRMSDGGFSDRRQNWNFDLGFDDGALPSNPAEFFSSLSQLRPGDGLPPFSFRQPNSPRRRNVGSAEDLRYSGQLNAPGNNDSSDNGATDSSHGAKDIAGGALPVLGSVVRGRCSGVATQENGKRAGYSMCAQTKSLIHSGLLPNSLLCVKSMTDCKGSPPDSSRSLPISVATSTDEEGSSLLFLAVSLGCSDAIVEHLIHAGASVDAKEIERAALTAQPKALSVLLRHAVYSDGDLNLDRCTAEVRSVLRAAQERRKVQEELMRNRGRSFVSVLLTKLVRLALSCYRNGSKQSLLVGRSVAETLVGKVLLHTMHQSQHEAKVLAKGVASAESVSHGEADSEDGRVPCFCSDETSAQSSRTPRSPLCLLEILPADVLYDTFSSSDDQDVTPALMSFLSLVETYLWSRSVRDVAVGLTMILVALRKIPLLRTSTVLERFGFRALALSHEAFAKRLVVDLNARRQSSSLSDHYADDRISRNVAEEPPAITGVVLCPKKHVAELHLTRHSSFRCDICGVGVERGVPMHGCRACDWDACEDCTDKAEGGVMKWRYIQGMARECQRLLSTPSTLSELSSNSRKQDTDLLDAINAYCGSVDFVPLEQGLTQHDVGALKELSSYLDTPGRITMHEFSSSILPAIHSALILKQNDRRNVDRGTVDLGAAWNRRRKKPRVGKSFHETDETSELTGSTATSGEEFSKLVVEHLVLIPDTNLDTDTSPSEVSGLDESKSNIHHAQTHDAEDEIGSDDDSSDHKAGEIQKMQKTRLSPEILRRVNVVLAFNERALVINNKSGRNSASTSDVGGLRSLTTPIEIDLRAAVTESASFARSQQGEGRGAQGYIISVEPLVSYSALEMHVLRACQIHHPGYTQFCRRLALDRALIAERPAFTSSLGGLPCRRLAQVVSYDEKLGVHGVRYVSRTTGNSDEVNLTLDSPHIEQLEFKDTEDLVVLAAKDYYILHRSRTSSSENAGPLDMDTELLLTDADFLLANEITVASTGNQPGVHLSRNSGSEPCSPLHSVGVRVESRCGSPDEMWRAFTVISVERHDERSQAACLPNYVLVSDEGDAYRDVEMGDVRSCDSQNFNNNTERERDRAVRRNYGAGALVGSSRVADVSGERSYPFWGGRRTSSDTGSQDLEEKSPSSTGVLKRTWSALSPIKDMNPLELNAPALSDKMLSAGGKNARKSLTCSTCSNKVEVVIDRRTFETPPGLCVEFSAHEDLPTCSLGTSGELTVFGALRRLLDRDDKTRPCAVPCGGRCKLFFSISVEDRLPKGEGVNLARFEIEEFLAPVDASCWLESAERGRQVENDLHNRGRGVCEAFDETCLQCMEVLSALADAAERHTPKLRDGAEETDKPIESENDLKTSVESFAFFESVALTEKLLDQLEDPLIVVSGALPEWCTAGPTNFCRVFSYASRRLLLERAAFGVSRSALKQQEAKVAVGPLRQRMAALRGRAVELVGEAFSGEALDPTALQLQADELYGMEEALASRVKAAFRAQRWDERSLQCAKAAVRRGSLLSDAYCLMEHYANDKRILRRRLEVRFDGESGFDLGSDAEAGVTRGFYSDIAEQLLSCEHVSGLYCKALCAGDSDMADAADCVSILPALSTQAKLPLWIPDMDSSRLVVIPTPRANPRSGLGVYPRPLSPHHPQLNAVLDQFRFMGRLFASAMRDGFLFPLPLSTAFLKLVQRGDELCNLSESLKHVQKPGAPNNAAPELDQNLSTEEMSVSDVSVASLKRTASLELTSFDLPRPGFLGGEVYAAQIICQALDELDEACPPLSKEEYEKQCKIIASDKNFARKVLGKVYDCSFEQYFEDRRFVDPLDPVQGEEALPLCHNGHMCPVTISNVREWVSLAKDFILRDGVLQQALAFRQGIADFFPADYLRLFTADELQRDVCGGGDNVDKWDEPSIRQLFKLDGGRGAAEALVAVAAMGGEGGAALSRRFGPGSPTIGYLVKALLEASPTKRRQFLSFVTSVPIVTPGRIEVVPVVNPSGEFLPMHDPGCLPRANTCTRKLYLPKFESYESFTQVLWAVVREESRFKGFYEWRG